MKAVLVEAPYQVGVRDVEVPALRENEVLIKVKAAGICGSDIHVYKGLHPFRKPPVIIGHEVSGEVIQVGKSVAKIKTGDLVTVEPQVGCGSCEYCLKGQINYCDHRGAPGVRGWYGTMAEYFAAPENCVYVLPEGVDSFQGALVEPLAVGVHAVRKAHVQLGEKIAIMGVGPIGLLTLTAAKAAGATTILATDVIDYCLESAKKMGATRTINTRENSVWIDDAKQWAGGEFDKVFVTAAAPGIINDALKLLRKGGRVIVISMFHSDQSFDVSNLQLSEKEIVGCLTYTREDTLAAIELLRGGHVRTDIVITHTLPYEQASEGFHIVEQKADSSIKVLITF